MYFYALHIFNIDGRCCFFYSQFQTGYATISNTISKMNTQKCTRRSMHSTWFQIYLLFIYSFAPFGFLYQLCTAVSATQVVMFNFSPIACFIFSIRFSLLSIRFRCCHCQMKQTALDSHNYNETSNTTEHTKHDNGNKLSCCSIELVYEFIRVFFSAHANVCVYVRCARKREYNGSETSACVCVCQCVQKTICPNRMCASRLSVHRFK